MSDLRERIYQRTGFSNVELDAVMAVVGPLVEQLRQAEDQLRTRVDELQLERDDLDQELDAERITKPTMEAIQCADEAAAGEIELDRLRDRLDEIRDAVGAGPDETAMRAIRRIADEHKKWAAAIAEVAVALWGDGYTEPQMVDAVAHLRADRAELAWLHAEAVWQQEVYRQAWARATVESTIAAAGVSGTGTEAHDGQ